MSDERISLFVVGAHLSGMPLNHELTSLNAHLLYEVRTATDYKLFALPNTSPPKPGLLRVPGYNGPGIVGEVWALPPEAFGRVIAKIPSPLGIGKILLQDGTEVSGFLCEAFALQAAQDVTAFGGWRAFMESLQ